MKHESESSFRREVREPVMNGNLFTRSLVMRTLASLQRKSIVEMAAQLYPNDRSLHQLVTRAASNPAMTSVAGWAMELAHKVVADYARGDGCRVRCR
jgi:hypothetical protein